MDPLAAIGVVLATYTALGLIGRRLVLLRSRGSGPELALLAGFDHAALARELASELLPRPGPGQGAPHTPALTRSPQLPPLGSLPEPWGSCEVATGDVFAAARARIERGEAEAAAALDVPPGALGPLLAWACLSRLFAGEGDGALAAARALEAADASLGARLVAQVLARRAEVLPAGAERTSLCEAALGACRRAGAAAPDAPPALAGLAAHLDTLRIDLWNLEIGAFLVRRALDRIERRAPDAAFVHLSRAHLAAVLGDGESAMEHLARALYHARGDPFYARLIGASPYVERVRPSLAAHARSLQRGRD